MENSSIGKGVETSIPQIPPTVIALIIGLIVGLLIGFYLPRKQSTTLPQQQVTQNAPVQNAPAVQPATPPVAQEQGFYGNVVKNAKGTLTVQEMLSGKEKGTHIYSVSTNAQTLFTYQKPTGSKDATQAAFTPVKGSVSDIKSDWFVFISTKDDIASTKNVTATQITYSEKSPFKQ